MGDAVKNKQLAPNEMDFVTVLSIGSLENRQEQSPKMNNNDYVTVLTIGDTLRNTTKNDTIEEVLVYRLPGERLGFGLKFEGGTKSDEFVKRLFIQSCAPDSPASMAKCSWGQLVEGDEVLQIDLLPVSAMTRIDCVRCLKDSNVVIKMVVKHVYNPIHIKGAENSAILNEDSPLVISAEKKRPPPPPPPPVPPRRIPRKLSKESKRSHTVNEVPFATDAIRTSQTTKYLPEQQNYKNKQLSDESELPPNALAYTDLISQEQSYYLSESDDTESSISTVIDRQCSLPNTATSSFAGSLPSTPTAVQRHLNLPPGLNANDEFEMFSNENDFFVDLFSHTEFMKEDNTESPNMDNNYFKCTLSPKPHINFFDAQLSYGNEKVECVEAATEETQNRLKDENANCIGVNKNEETNNKQWCKQMLLGDNKLPTSLPRFKSRSLLPIEPSLKKCLDNVDNLNLPRLVYAVPKVNATVDDILLDRENLFADTIKHVQQFLNKEREHSHLYATVSEKLYGVLNSPSMESMFTSDLYNFDWRLSPQLTTIGEDDEEEEATVENTPLPAMEDLQTNFTMNVIEELTTLNDNDMSSNDVDDNVDLTSQKKDLCPQEGSGVKFSRSSLPLLKDTERSISLVDEPLEEKLPYFNTNSLPPFWKVKNKSSLFRDEQSSCSVREKIEIFSNTFFQRSNSPAVNLKKHSKSSDDLFTSSNIINESLFSNTRIIDNTLNKKKNPIIGRSNSIDHYTYQKSKAQSFVDLTSCEPSEEHKSKKSNLQKRHSFSQSMFDVNLVERNRKSDRWSLLAEQRHRSLSKLKGLVIPEQVDEVEDPVVVDLPEIKIKDPPIVPKHFITLPAQTISTQYRNAAARDCTQSVVSKYFPAFKKNFHVHNNNIQYNNKGECKPSSFVCNLESNYSLLLDDNKSSVLKSSESLTEAPRSLESITSPTQSDCSFEYSSSCSDTKQEVNNKMRERETSHSKEDTMKSEDESDNDSAVSSSQSSYISKVSPPVSPNGYLNNSLPHDIKMRCRLDNGLHNRLLKAHSVEAINRKNILASAKCRSGQDLKRGSALIETQLEEGSKNVAQNESIKLCNKSSNFIVDENNKLYDTHNSKINNFSPVDCMSDKSSDYNVEKQQNYTNNGDSVKTSHFARIKYGDSKTKEDILSDKTINNNLKSYFKNSLKNTKSASVTDIRRSFEQLAPMPLESKRFIGKVSTLPANSPNQTSSNPDTSQHSSKTCPPVNTNSLNLTTTTEKKTDLEIITVVPDIPGGRVGITLAGGADYETKDVTIYKIRCDSPAHRDGRLQKGDQIIAINGKTVEGLTHAELAAAMKEPLPAVTLAVTRKKSLVVLPNLLPISNVNTNGLTNTNVADKGSIYVVPILKYVSGLGFSLDGGQDSLMGNIPLIIKKVFKGGAAEKCGAIYVGDQLLKINDIDVSGFTRFEAWSVLKKLPEGDAILLTIKR